MTTLNQTRPQPAHLPSRLSFQGGTMLHAGPGRTASSFAYLDPMTQAVHDVFLGVTIRTGPHFSLVEVPGNPALRRVRIDADSFGQPMPLEPGQEVLIAGLEQKPDGLRARSAWFLPKAKPAPTPVRHLRPAHPPLAAPRLHPENPPAAARQRRFIGRICTVAPAGTFGFIQPEKGHELFVAGAELGGGARLVVGEVVSYAVGSNLHGPCAVAARPA